MKITKYEHACIALEEQGSKLVIDPGSFTAEFGELAGITAVVVTHVHADHFDPGHLDAIVAANPAVQVFAPEEVVANWGAGKAIAVKAGDEHSIGVFKLRFYGETHAEIHRSFPRPQNVGVMVNNELYYPGDSFVAPDSPVTILAVPAGGPWVKIGEAIDFLYAVKPARFFRTHDAPLSQLGQDSADAWLQKAAEAMHATYVPLQNGASIES